MKHRSTTELFEYWNERRGNRLAPERGEIEPGAIRRVLGDAFIIAHDTSVDHPLRLAGTRLCALFCRELKGIAFPSLWSEACRRNIRDLIHIVADESVGLVAAATATGTDGGSIELELLLLPLRHRGRSHARLIGVLAPIVPPYWLGASPLTQLSLGPLRHVGPAVETIAAPRFITAGRDGRVKHGMVVYDGGRV